MCTCIRTCQNFSNMALTFIRTLKSIMILSIALAITGGDGDVTTPDYKFHCFKCSYAHADVYNAMDCLNNTAALPQRLYTLPCNNYCTVTERWSKVTKKVDSVFRSCNKYLGNDCIEERFFITCQTSCTGNYCNNITVGGGHESHCNDEYCSYAHVLKSSFTQTVIILCILLTVFNAM